MTTSVTVLNTDDDLIAKTSNIKLNGTNNNHYNNYNVNSTSNNNNKNYKNRAVLPKTIINEGSTKDNVYVYDDDDDDDEDREDDDAKFNLKSHSSRSFSPSSFLSIPYILCHSIRLAIEITAALRNTIARRSICATEPSMDRTSRRNNNINPSFTAITTNQADFVFFAAATAAFAASVATVTATPFSFHSTQDNTSFNYYDGTAIAFATEKDAINRSFLPTTTATTAITATTTIPADTSTTTTTTTTTATTTVILTSMNVITANETATTTTAVTVAAAAAAAAAANANATATIATEDWAHFYDLMLSWQGICLITVFCTFIVITIIGNTLVILAVITTRRLKTVTNCFVMSLAVADLLVGIFVMPPAVAVHLIGSWQLGWILCDIWISLDVLLCTASILSLCAISVDRYLAVTQPLNYSRKRRSKRLALIMILIVWVLALAITCPPMLGWYEPGRRDLEECRYNQNEGYVIFSAMGSFFIPMAVMIYVYARISCVIASRHDNMTDISVHNKKFKRYTSADVDNDIDHYLSEQELSSTQKKQMAARTFSNQTIVKELHEVMLSDGGENGATRASHCHSLLALPTTGNSKNSCYELTRPTSLRRSPTPSTTMTSGCGGTTIGSTGMSSLDGSDARMMEQQHHWPYSGGGNGSGGIHARTHSMRHQQHQHQHQHQQHHHHLNAATGGTGGTGVGGILIATSSHQQHHENNMTITSTTATTTSTSTSMMTMATTAGTQPRQARIYQQPHNHHHTKSLSNRITSLKKENKTTQTLSIVVGGFIACWLPFFVYYLITPFIDEKSSTLTHVLTWLGWFNSAINPFIYAFYSVDFRAAFWRLTCKRFFSSSSKPQFPTNTMSIRR